jgi:hypothetical protein
MLKNQASKLAGFNISQESKQLERFSFSDTFENLLLESLTKSLLIFFFRIKFLKTVIFLLL